jgi:hypothetical protein
MSGAIEELDDEQFEAGKTCGRQWAEQDAEYAQLKRVAEYAPQRWETVDAETVERLVDPEQEIDASEWREFWDYRYGDEEPSSEFVLGFIAGVHDLFAEIADRIQ